MCDLVNVLKSLVNVYFIVSMFSSRSCTGHEDFLCVGFKMNRHRSQSVSDSIGFLPSRSEVKVLYALTPHFHDGSRYLRYCINGSRASIVSRISDKQHESRLNGVFF